MDLLGLVRDIQDFPRAGVVFKDLTPLFADRDAFAHVVGRLSEGFEGVDLVCGVEARGFILAGAVAHALGAGFVPVRKAGKLPWEVEALEYALEYGTDQLEIHSDAVHPGQRVLVIDDVLATGGTAATTGSLLRQLGGEVVAFAFLIQLAFLGGRGRLAGEEIRSLMVLDGP